ncbi:acyltransferase, partial [Fulvivirga aurantia]|uniref:acyltransferase n=1 Tax=Fulvivirga aurantia TaxID=2529383 RepID=UPI003CCD0668
LGNYNVIGKNVTITNQSKVGNKVVIGDCNIFHDNTRIIVGEEDVNIGDWNVFHNNILMIGIRSMKIGHNCWFGQNTVIDSSGALKIGNGVRVGMYSQIWTHVASGELIEGCSLFGFRETIIEDDVWLVGSCIVSSGIRIRRKTIALANSNLTKDTEEESVYAGSPAKKKENLNFYKKVTLEDKMQMIVQWAETFTKIHTNCTLKVDESTITLKSNTRNEEVVI